MYYFRNINPIILRRFNKILIDESDLDVFFNQNISTKFENELSTTDKSHNIQVESCDLLNCIINVDNKKLKFENGILINKSDAEKLNDPLFVEKIEDIVSFETENIREHLELPLTLNENIIQIGYCMSIDFVKKIALNEEEYFENFSNDLVKELVKLCGRVNEDDHYSDNDDSLPSSLYDPPYPNFPREHINSNSFMEIYNRWLSILKCSNLNGEKFFSIINNKSSDITVKKIISTTNTNEITALMVNLMKSPNLFSDIDISDLNSYFVEVYYYNRDAFPLDEIDKITNLDNLNHITNFLFRYSRENINYKLEKVYEKIGYDVIDIYKLNLLLSDYTISEVNRIQPLYIEEKNFYKDFLMHLLDKCKNRYEKMLKERYKWARFSKSIQPDDYKDSYPEVSQDLKRIEKQNIFNNDFLKMRNKIILDKEGDFNEMSKASIEKAIKEDTYLSSSQYHIKVNTCNLLYCHLTINNKDNIVNMEFENGKLLNPGALSNEKIENKIKSIMKEQIKIISRKIFSFLIFNKKIMNYTYSNYYIDIKLALKLLLFNETELDEIYNVLKEIFHSNSSISINYKKSNIVYNIEKYISSDLAYQDYCVWLYSLEYSKCNKELIPKSYKINFKKLKCYERLKMETEHLKLNIISYGNEDEYFKMITDIMVSFERISYRYILYLKSFIKYEEQHFKYIPKEFPNKKNLVKIVNILINYYGKKLPFDSVLPLFHSANDVLLLAYELSKDDSYNYYYEYKKNKYKIKFKSFNNFERRLLMKLLNGCENRYEDIRKHKNEWVRLCEKIHPNKFKTIYPEVVNDLLGSYQFLGNKERKEYLFYKKLYAIDDRLRDYKKEINQFVEIEMKRIKVLDSNHCIHNIMDAIININKNEEYHNIIKKWKWIHIGFRKKLFLKRGRCNRVIDYFFVKPISHSEHEKLLKEFENLKGIPNDLKEYLHQYLIYLSTIAYNNILQKMNNQFIHNYWIGYFNNERKGFNVFEKYKDYFSYLTNMLNSCNNVIFPTLDRSLIEKRLHELQPMIDKLNEQNHQFQKENQSFNSKYVQLIQNKKINEAAQLLSSKPDVFSRHLNELITKKGENYDSILDIFEQIAPKTSMNILLSIKGFFQTRNNKLEVKSFLFKNRKTRNKNIIYYTNKVKEPLPEEVCQNIIRICDQALISHYKSKPKLEKVYISSELKDILIPLSKRLETNNEENFTKGSRISLSCKNRTSKEKEVIIENIEKNIQKKITLENHLKNEKTQIETELMNPKNGYSITTNKDIYKNTLDVINKDINTISNEIENIKEELYIKRNYFDGNNYKKIRLFSRNNFYIDIFDEDFNYKSMVCQHNSASSDHSNEFNIYYNSTIKDSYKYFYFDIDMEEILVHQGRYIVVNIFGNFGDNRTLLGLMEREYLNSDENFEPSAVPLILKFKCDRDICPVILDCKTREFIWVNHCFPMNYFHAYINYYKKYQDDITFINAIINLSKEFNDKSNSNNTHSFIEKNKKFTIDGTVLSYKDVRKYIKSYRKYNHFFNLNKKMKKTLFYYYLNPTRISVSELIHLHIKASDGTLLKNKDDLQEENYAFVLNKQVCRKNKVKYIPLNNLK